MPSASGDADLTDVRRRRAEGLRALNALHVDPDPSLSRIVRLASAIADVPYAAVHILDDQQQRRIAGHGIDDATYPVEAPREDTPCRLVVDGGQVIATPDATQDDRFGFSTLVAGDTPIRFYVSAPLKTQNFGVLGTLCVWDTDPRSFDPAQVDRLEDLAMMVVDALEAGRTMQRLAQAAMTDPLTGLPNRRRVYDTLERQMHRRSRDGTAVTVAFIDLDNFKGVNDAHGHQVGDLVLNEVASRLCDVARSDEMVGRIGGDEFVIVGSAGMQANEAVDRFAGSVASPIHTPAGPLRIRASIGVAIARDGDTADSVLTRADSEMFKVKRSHTDP